jgi:DNA repair photolyase
MSKALKILSRPKGNAEEYGKWSVNPYKGCSHGCLYCYLKKGAWANGLGGDTAQMKTGVVSDEHAYHLAMAEIFEHRKEIIRDGGLFMTFTSDPCAAETRYLFFRIATQATQHDIPVTLLTKNADFFKYNTIVGLFDDAKRLGALPKDELEKVILNSSMFSALIGNYPYIKQQLAFGWTLTGRDELEPNASPNAERIATMKCMSDKGYLTWASIEPVIDFKSSLEMICQALEAGCKHFKIGLLTDRTRVVRKPFSFGDHHFEAYDLAECCSFTGYVMELTQGRATVYWKQSFYDFLQGPDKKNPQPIHGMTAYEFLHQWSHSVDKDWSMFNNNKV